MKFLALVLMSLATPALAAFEVRNGGFVMLCPSSNATSSYILLDLAVPQKLVPANGWLYSDEQLELSQYVQNILEQIRPFDAPFADFLQANAAYALDHLKMFHKLPEGMKLNEASLWDSSRVERTDCTQLTQIALQEPSWMFARDVNVVKPLWDKLDLTNRAALIVHEVVYGFFVQQAPALPAASESRAFVRSLFTPGMWSQTMTQQRYDAQVGQRYNTASASFSH